MSFSSAERAQLVSLLHELGPQAPTLCAGWTTFDMAAHLWLREHKPLAAAGMFVPALAGVTEKAMREAKRRDFDELVDAWGSGPDKANPLRCVEHVANFAENFVHHEDVRRANGMTETRDFSSAVKDQMYKALKLLAPQMVGKSRLPVALFPKGYKRVLAADTRGVATEGDAVVTVTGEVSELLLWIYGRDEVHLDIVGDESAIVRSAV